MARKSKTEYALLGILSLGPMSGYDIKAFITTSIGFFWQESYGQIYPTLRRLREQKLVNRKVSRQKGRPDRHVYSLTAAGRRRLSNWLAADIEPEPVRLELLLKMFFGRKGSPKDLIRHVETLLKQQTGRMKAFSAVRKSSIAQHQDLPDFPFWLSTLSFGEHVTRARIRWCRETLVWLKKYDRQSKSKKSSRRNN
jgi:DNA-binding PadR family transcriptional regulator